MKISSEIPSVICFPLYLQWNREKEKERNKSKLLFEREWSRDLEKWEYSQTYPRRFFYSWASKSWSHHSPSLENAENMEGISQHQPYQITSVIILEHVLLWIFPGLQNHDKESSICFCLLLHNNHDVMAILLLQHVLCVTSTPIAIVLIQSTFICHLGYGKSPNWSPCFCPSLSGCSQPAREVST